MNDTFRLGRIAGIPVGLNWTWLFVVALFVWSLAAAVFPSTNPGLGTATYVVMGVVSVLLFFGSLLLHELGHALQARRDGVEIDGITLWLFGGVSRFRGMFPSAGAEFRIAIAGPLVTAVLTAVFLGLAALTHFQPAVDAVFTWVGYINLLLLGFNLLPALPLDGGRVFRATLWRIRGDLAWATRIAAGIGSGIGGVMIAAGVITLFAYDAFTGVWLALIGWIVLGAAGSEARLVSLRDALDGLVVADLTRLHPIVAQADQTVRDFMAEIPWEDDSRAYPVLDGLRPVGLLPSRRLADITAGRSDRGSRPGAHDAPRPAAGAEARRPGPRRGARPRARPAPTPPSSSRAGASSGSSTCATSPTRSSQDDAGRGDAVRAAPVPVPRSSRCLHGPSRRRGVVPLLRGTPRRTAASCRPPASPAGGRRMPS